jgi:hypothetical protein
MRLHLHFPDVPIPDSYERISVTREVDTRKTRQLNRAFFEWLNEVTIADWTPFMILPGSTVSKHFHFQVRWDDPVVQEKCTCHLQLLTNRSDKWRTVSEWRISLDKSIWSELLTHGNTIGFPPVDPRVPHAESNPRDLYKYVGLKDEIPLGGFGAGPSYVDWPEEANDRKRDSPSA